MLRRSQASNLTTAVLAVCLLLACSSADGSQSQFSIINEHLTEDRSQEFHAGVCNSSLPLNDHLYQLIGWCRQLSLGQKCLSHGAVTCLFKKYVDIARSIARDEGATRDELNRRLAIFRDNLIAVVSEIEAHLDGMQRSGSAASNVGAARFGITKFMHLSPTEFRERYLTSLKASNATAPGDQSKANILHYNQDTNSYNYNSGSYRARNSARVRRSLSDGGSENQAAAAAFVARPNRVDWRERGVVTAVKNQGPCGACWAFAVTEVAESEFASKYGTLAELSVQQVTDCTACGVCAGCRGGDICQAAAFYSTANQRIVEDRFYPYVAKDTSCRKVTSGYQVQTAGVTCQSYVNREDSLVEHLWQSGTAAVAVDAHLWQYYVDGTIMHNCAAELNHAVQLVGYDLTSGPVPFYLVRNSWGADWGMSGYLQIAEGSNLCGLAQGVVTFTVA